MTLNLNRRAVLQTGATIAAAALLPSMTIQPAAAATAVRRDVGTLAANDPILTGYRTAIAAMKALPDADPTSWAYQAAIHGSTLGAARPGWDACEHFNYLFWSWHRMYLYWFERIVRSKSGVADWALPYWDWTQPSERALPAAFRDASSELFVANRNANMNDGTGALADETVALFGMSLVPFSAASSVLEGTPHGAVHNAVGGGMGNFDEAGLDPIFWLHHSNVDRLWNLWLAQGGPRKDPTDDAAWKSAEFTFFREDGAQVKMSGCQVLRAAQQLGYNYENEPPQVAPYCARRLRILRLQKVRLFRLPSPDPVILNERVSLTTLIRPGDLATFRRVQAVARDERRSLLLEFNGVEADRAPGAIWQVFVGLPRDAQRTAQSPHFVGNVALFGAGVRNQGRHHFKPAEFTFPLDRAVAAAGDAQGLDVTFVPSSGVVVEGRPTQPRVQAAVRIREITVSAIASPAR